MSSDDVKIDSGYMFRAMIRAMYARGIPHGHWANAYTYSRHNLIFTTANINRQFCSVNPEAEVVD
jgi:hypothetical protein